MKRYKLNTTKYVSTDFLEIVVSEPNVPNVGQNKCLYCYGPLKGFNADFHQACNKKFFGQLETPFFDYSKDDLSELAKKVIQTQTVVTGVQAKVSLSVTRKNSEHAAKLTIVGLYGDYILKPPSDYYPHLPEVEDVTMHLAEVCGLNTVPHTLVYLQDGTMCYLTKRVDRTKGNKLHMEDMCQLSERLTEDKYKGSHEQVAKLVKKYSANPLLDVVNFYDLVLFCYVTGNADMHLKNFSLLQNTELEYQLSPAYDLLATVLVNPSDKEELALTLNGKKSKLTYTDFLKAYETSGLSKKLLDKTFDNFETCLPFLFEKVENSFLSNRFKYEYNSLLANRFNTLKQTRK